MQIGGLGGGVDPPNNRKPIGYVFTYIVLFVLIPWLVNNLLEASMNPASNYFLIDNFFTSNDLMAEL